MRALSASELLEVWERGSAQVPVERALTLLGAACDDQTPQALARLSIGRRDALLFTLRERTFGPHLNGLADCPGCGAVLETHLNASDLRVEPKGGPRADLGEAAETLTLAVAGCEVSFRLPHSLDLLAVADGGRTNDASARTLLIERCLVAAERDGERLDAGRLPPPVIEAMTRRMAEADPQAEVQFALACPECGAHWHSLFDIESFFWAEINAWAHRTVGEVHVLASAYGWHEADILNMSAWRRQCYLNLTGA
jgi:hypothetical protein